MNSPLQAGHLDITGLFSKGTLRSWSHEGHGRMSSELEDFKELLIGFSNSILLLLIGVFSITLATFLTPTSKLFEQAGHLTLPT